LQEPRATVQVFNSKLQLANTIPVNGVPVQLVFTPSQANAYGSNQAGTTKVQKAGYLSYIDVSAGTVQSTITSFKFNSPTFLAMKPDGTVLYIAKVDSFSSTGVENSLS